MAADSLTGTFSGVFSDYQNSPEFLDEVFDSAGAVKAHYQQVLKQFLQYRVDDFRELNDHAKLSFFNQGVKFAVYSDKAKGVERIFPFDLFPRIVRQRSGRSWRKALFSATWP